MRQVLNIMISLIMMISMNIQTIYAQETEEMFKASAVTVIIPSACERETNFNDGWKFYLGDSSIAQNVNFDDSSWMDVSLPHDFSISQNFTTSSEAEAGFLPGGTGWYRKSFTLSAQDAGKSILINFDGVYSVATVYVNGTEVGQNCYGYNNFAFDISDYVTCDGVTDNVIAVKAVNQIPSSRFYSGSGIYRDVTLIVTDPIHVAYNGTTVTTPDISSGSGKVEAAVEVDNDTTSSQKVSIKNTVYDHNGNVVSDTAESSATIDAGGEVTLTASPVVTDPDLWSIESPVLYTLKTEVYVDNVLKDTYETTFGFRWFSFDKTNGFYLNGKAVKLNGVCLHHDQGAAGSAAYDDAIYRQLSMMKDMGVNAVRTTHNPADEDFIRICNELGILVIEELFDNWTYAKNGNTYDFSQYFNTSLSSSNQILNGDSSMTWSEYVAKSVAKRDRNDPSLIMYSLCNEVQSGGSSDSTYSTIAQNLINWIRSEDSLRMVTIGDDTRSTSTTTNIGAVLKVIQDNGGVLGFNYATGSKLSTLNSYWTAPIYSSESSSATNSRSQYASQASNAAIDGKMHLTSYDTSNVSWGMTAHVSLWNTLPNDYVAGEFVWTGFDYIGEPTPYNGTGTGSVSGSGAIPNSSYFGIVDTAGFAKDTYYLYRAQWNQKSTTLHLVTAWDSDNMLTENNKTPVVIYTNAPVVKLYRNGSLIGTASRTENTTAAGHAYYTYTTQSNDSANCTAVAGSDSTSLYATFNVAFASGTISAKAYDTSGKEITDTYGNSSVSTPGFVSKLEVSQDKTVIDADGASLVYVEVSVEDAEGNLDTTAVNTIQFSVSGNGEIIGVDNGDQATTEKFQQSSVMDSKTSAHIAAYGGKALVIVKSTKEAGSFTVNVTSEGLTGGKAMVKTQAVEDATEGIVSYTMVRDYSVMTGTVPVLETEATGTMADGSIVNGIISWENVSSNIFGVPGDYTIHGFLKFDKEEAIAVTAKLHVIANVTAIENISCVSATSTIPSLPSTVKGIMADGTITGEFNVIWDELTENQFNTAGSVVTVNGTATILGSHTLPVTCKVRVADEVNTDSTNVAGSATVTQDALCAANPSDNLSSVNNGTTTFVDDTSERWTNWNNRTNSATATLTFSWTTAQNLSSANLYYYYDSCCAYPESVVFEYSLDGNTFTAINTTSTLITSATLGAEYAYTFEKVICPVALRLTFTQQSGTTGSHCVGLIEAQMMTYTGKVSMNTGADLKDIKVNGTSLENFKSSLTSYDVSVDSVRNLVITASSEENAAITVLPVHKEADGTKIVRILTVSEDGTASRTYTVNLNVQNVTEATLSIDACKGSGDNMIVFTGKISNMDEIDVSDITSHGIIYIKTSKLGSGTLTLSSAGRMKASSTKYGEDGSFSYTKRVTDVSETYCARAYVIYKDKNGRKHSLYSDPITVSALSLQEEN